MVGVEEVFCDVELLLDSDDDHHESKRLLKEGQRTRATFTKWAMEFDEEEKQDFGSWETGV